MAFPHGVELFLIFIDFPGQNVTRKIIYSRINYLTLNNIRLENTLYVFKTQVLSLFYLMVFLKNVLFSHWLYILGVYYTFYIL